MEDIRILWKSHNIEYAIMEFDCGGDSMNHTEFHYYTKNGKEIEEVRDLTIFFNDEVYRYVDFYQNSDGHYQGEAGQVKIELEDYDFTYSKSSQSEYNESEDDKIDILLTADELFVVNEYIKTIFGDSQRDPQIVYKRDCFLSEETIDKIEKLVNKIDEIVRETPLKNCDDEHDPEFDYRWSTNNLNETDLKEVLLEDNSLKVFTSKSYTIYKSE